MHLRRRIAVVKSSREKVALLLDLADMVDDPDERLALVEEAHQTDPLEETALRRLIRLVSARGDAVRLGHLYRHQAEIAEDPLSASTALHLAFLSLADPTPIRLVMGRVLLESNEARIPASAVDPFRFVDEQFVRLLARPPTADERGAFARALKSDPNVTPRLVLLTLITSPEYQSY